MKIFWQGCAAPVFVRIPLAIRKFWSKTYPWLRRISLSWALSYVILRNFSPNIPSLREIVLKKHNLAPKCPFLGVFVNNKDFGRKIYLWLRNICQKYTVLASPRFFIFSTSIYNTMIQWSGFCIKNRFHTITNKHQCMIWPKNTHITEMPLAEIPHRPHRVVSQTFKCRMPAFKLLTQEYGGNFKSVISERRLWIKFMSERFIWIRPTIPEIQLLRNLTLKHPRSRSWVRSKVKVTYYIQYPTDAFLFRFTSIELTIPEVCSK